MQSIVNQYQENMSGKTRPQSPLEWANVISQFSMSEVYYYETRDIDHGFLKEIYVYFFFIDPEHDGSRQKTQRVNQDQTIFLNSLFSCLTPLVPASASPGGRLTVLLKTFSNPSSKDFNGDCCESSCRGCDYFLKICLKQTAGGSCVWSATTNIYYNAKYVVFKKYEGFSSGGKNPSIWHLSSWTVS